MAVIKLNLRELNRLLGFSLEREELLERLPLLGCDIEDFDEENIYAEFFPNRPDLYSAEGVARALKSFYGKRAREQKLLAPRTHIDVDGGLKKIRPYVVACEVEGVKLSYEGIQGIMELQEGLHWALGRDRRKVSIGLHDPEGVTPPFKYSAVKDGELKFVPLEMQEELELKEVLERHPKGEAYGHIISGSEYYPLILDSHGRVLSMPPIINAELTRVSEGTESFFVEITGTDMELISKALNILTMAFLERGFSVYQVEVRYGERTLLTPDLTPEQRELSLSYMNRLLGAELSGGEAVESLERMGYSARASGGRLEVEVPPYRADILHGIDLVEDVAVGYGYENFSPKLPSLATTGREHRLEKGWSRLRKLLLGYGLSEVMSLMLSNEREGFEKMLLEDKARAVSIKNPISEEHTLVRSSLLPSLLNVLRINRHHELPQRIFEIGDAARLDPSEEEGARRERLLAMAIIHSRASFTELKSLAEALLRDLGVQYELEPLAHRSFIPGRCAGIVSSKKKVGYFGELHPQVITNFELEYPVIAMEMDIELL